MKFEATPARDKASAIALIQAGGTKIVDLDYETGFEDAVELGKLGRQHGVSVMFRSQEAIAVDSPADLQRGLADVKDTWRMRVLLCQFPLHEVPAEERVALLARADELKDLIVPF